MKFDLTTEIKKRIYEILDITRGKAITDKEYLELVEILNDFKDNLWLASYDDRFEQKKIV